MEFLDKLLEFGIKAMDIYAQSMKEEKKEVDNDEVDDSEDNNDSDEDDEECVVDKEPRENDDVDDGNSDDNSDDNADTTNKTKNASDTVYADDLTLYFLMLRDVIVSIPTQHVNKLITSLEFAKYDHSTTIEKNRENRIHTYSIIYDEINGLTIPTHRERAQDAYNKLCDKLGLKNLPSDELSYILKNDSSLSDDIRNVNNGKLLPCFESMRHENVRYALIVLLNLIGYDALY